MTTDHEPTPSTHDWHIGTDGLELLIRRDEAHTLAVSLGHENIDDKHVTTILATRLVEMIESVAPDAFEYHDARVRAEAAPPALDGLALNDMLDTIAGLTLANGAWSEGAGAMYRSIMSAGGGEWSRPASPYSAPLLARMAARHLDPDQENRP